MSRNRILFILTSILLSILIGFNTNLTLYEGTSVAMLIYILLDFLDNLGKKIVVLDIAVILAVFTWLIMPVIFYHNYTKADHTARIFYKYMPIASDDYFSFVLPGTIAMAIGMKLRLRRLEINTNAREYHEKLKQFFKGKDKIRTGFILIGISLASGILYRVLPGSLLRIVYLLEHLSYVGVFYIFFSEHKRKNLILLGVLSLMVINAMATAMFGELIYLMALFYILIAIYLKQPPFFTKLAVCVGGIFLIFLIQNVKSAYRLKAWTEGGNSAYFGQLVVDNISNPSQMFEKKKLFFTAVRLNQGWLIAVTMDRVPRRYEFAYGETIWTSIAAAFVPRIIWPDKPESGGKYNLKRFWGYNLVGYSMNIGPIGEAYANFDRTGGIIFMFLYGLTFNFMLTSLLKWSERRLSILCWIPVLFFYAVVVETDVLTTVSSVVTTMMFMVIFIWIFKKLFGIQL
jgi:hypothetical protein